MNIPLRDGCAEEKDERRRAREKGAEWKRPLHGLLFQENKDDADERAAHERGADHSNYIGPSKEKSERQCKLNIPHADTLPPRREHQKFKKREAENSADHPAHPNTSGNAKNVAERSHKRAAARRRGNGDCKDDGEHAEPNIQFIGYDAGPDINHRRKQEYQKRSDP